jgi:hypothetical protein
MQPILYAFRTTNKEAESQGHFVRMGGAPGDDVLELGGVVLNDADFGQLRFNYS